MKTINLQSPIAILIGMAGRAKEAEESSKIVTLPCGCSYHDKGWLLMRINECEYHKRKRNSKRPYKPKAECVRP